MNPPSESDEVSGPHYCLGNHFELLNIIIVQNESVSEGKAPESLLNVLKALQLKRHVSSSLFKVIMN